MVRAVIKQCNLIDREWVRKEIPEWTQHTKESFILHFGDVNNRQSLIERLIKIKQEPTELVASYIVDCLVIGNAHRPNFQVESDTPRLPDFQRVLVFPLGCSVFSLYEEPSCKLPNAPCSNQVHIFCTSFYPLSS